MPRSCLACSTVVPEEVRYCVACGQEVDDPYLDTVVGERYRLVQRIGVGGMGAVYRAEHTMMSKELAVKLLHPELGRLEELAERFKREAEAACRLEHINCIAVTDFGQTKGGSLFLVMEYLKGESLGDLLERGPIEQERAVNIARQVLAALEHAHGLGIVHRDLKPDNIMLVQKDGRELVKILDFGIAKLMAEADEDDGDGPGADALDDGPTNRVRRVALAKPLTQVGSVFGTPEYISPEQALGHETDARSDLYSFGCVLYEMLTGRRPFVSRDKVELLSMHLTKAPRPLRQVAPEAGISVPLEAIVLKAMAKKKDERFPSATAFLSALDALPAAGAGRLLSSDGTLPVTSLGGGRPTTVTGMGPAAPSGAVRTLAGAAWHWARDAARARPWAAVMVGAVAIVLIAMIVGLASGGGKHGGLATSPKASVKPGKPVKSPKPSPSPSARVSPAGSPTPSPSVVLPPRDARTALAEGHQKWDSDLKGALAAYKEAMAMDATVADTKLIENLTGLAVGKVRAWDESALLLLGQQGKAGIPGLTALASAGRTAKVRAGATAALTKLGAEAGIDRAGALILDLQQAVKCKARAALTRKLVTDFRGDPRTLETLRKLAGRRGGRFDNDPNACFRKELTALIEELSASAQSSPDKDG